MRRDLCGALCLVVALAWGCGSDTPAKTDAGAGAGGERDAGSAGRTGAGAGGRAGVGGIGEAAGGAGTSAADGGDDLDAEQMPPAEDAGLPDASHDAGAPLRVVLFSRTTGYRHAESIEAGRAALQAWAGSAGVSVTATEDASALIARLDETDVVVFFLTTGDVLDAQQQTAFEAFVRAGGGFVGVHSAADTEYDWPFYGELVGAWFDSHPAIQPATLHVEAREHPAAVGLPETWQRTDEWYNFRRNPRADVDIILTIDESTYQGGTMGSDHPIAWSHEVGAGRSIYTELAHGGGAWDEVLVRQHMQNAILWAGRRSAP